MNKLVDLNFGVNNQAMSILHMLDREPDFADYENGFYEYNAKTLPWYNGRESGFVIIMQEKYFAGKYINIAVFEHRNSDNICALKWVTDDTYLNHPLEDKNIFDIAYNGPEKTKYDVEYSVKYGECGKIANWVYEQLKSFYKSNKKHR